MSRATLIDRLKTDVAAGRVVTVAGSGVSVAASQNQKVDGEAVASWIGLLRHGAQHCVEIGAANEVAGKLLVEQIQSGETDLLISAAEVVSSRLRKKSPGVYRAWLNDTVGKLSLKDRALIDALSALPGVLATLNYDGLLEQATKWTPVSWKQTEKVQQVLRGEINGAVLHLHGWFEEPDSVVLGLASYNAVVDHPHARAVLHLFAVGRTLLFVGCGDTVLDPNFTRLIEWGATALADVAPRHYLLCRTSEVDGFRDKLADAPWLQPLDYGAHYEDLVPFLRSLAPAGESTVAVGDAPEPFYAPAPPPPPPDGFVARDEGARLLEHLLADSAPAAVGLTTGLTGAGGFGKTTLAKWVCQQERVRERFPDGILWVVVGENRTSGELVGILGDLCASLTGKRLEVTDPRTAGAHLGRIIGNRRVLLVVDDVWARRDLEPFLMGGKNCVRLVTTRVPGVLGEAPAVRVDQMTEGGTGALLFHGLPQLPGELAAALLRKSGRWPLLARLINAALSLEARNGSSVAEAAGAVLRELDRRGPAALDPEVPADREEAVRVTLDAGLMALKRSYGDRGDDAVACFRSLAVFPEDFDIDLAVLSAWWSTARGWSAYKARELCLRLAGLSLVQGLEGSTSTLRLHDVIRSYLRQDRQLLVESNRSLVASLRPPWAGGPPAWWALPDSQRSLERTLVMHLMDGELRSEAVALVSDLRYLASRISGSGLWSAYHDLELVRDGMDHPEPVLAELMLCLQQDAALLAGASAETAESTLYIRASASPLSNVRWSFRTSTQRPLLEPRHLPNAADPALMYCVPCAGVLPFMACSEGFERVALAALSSPVVEIFDGPSGKQLGTLEISGVRAIRFASPGRLIVGTERGELLLWDLDAKVTRPLSADGDRIDDMAVDLATNRIVVARRHGNAGRVEMLDIEGRPLSSVHDSKTRVRAVALHGDRVAILSLDETVIVDVTKHDTVERWSSEGVDRVAFDRNGRLLGFTAGTIWSFEGGDAAPRKKYDGPKEFATFARGWAFGAAPHFYAYSHGAGPVYVVDVDTGQAEGMVHGAARGVTGVVIDPAGKILAAAGDGELRAWNIAAMPRVTPLGQHEGWVRHVGFEPTEGRSYVTGSNDDHVRVFAVDHPIAAKDVFATGHAIQAVAMESPSAGLIVTSAGIQVWEGQALTPRDTHAWQSDHRVAAVGSCYATAIGHQVRWFGRTGGEWGSELFEMPSEIRAIALDVRPAPPRRFAVLTRPPSTQGVAQPCEASVVAEDTRSVTLPIEDPTAVALAGNFLVVADTRGMVGLVNIDSGDLLFQTHPHSIRTRVAADGKVEVRSSYVTAVAIHPRQHLAASASGGELIVYELPELREIVAARIDFEIFEMSWHPTLDMLLVGGSGGAFLFDVIHPQSGSS